MALTTSDYSELTEHLNEIYNEVAKEAVEDWQGKEFFDTAQTDWQTYTYQQMDGVAKFDRVAEGAQLPVASSVAGDSVTGTQKRYGGRVSVTKDMRMFERYDQIDTLVRSAVEAAFNRIDQSQADLLLNGFTSTSYTDIYGDTQSNVSVDGVVLFSASHTNNQNSDNYRNLIKDSAATANPGLGRDPLVTARKDALVHKDANTLNRPIHLKTLVVTPTNEDLAERIVLSSGVQGTPNVDSNPLKGKISSIKVWTRLETSGQGTDTSAYWFMLDPKNVKGTLKSPFAQKPQMGEAEQVHDSLNWEYVIDSYYVIFAGHAVNVWGSTGAN